MKKLVITLLVVVMLLASTSVVFADAHFPTEYEGRVESGAFTTEGAQEGQIVNVANPDLRFYYADGTRDAGVIIIPSDGPDQNASMYAPFSQEGYEGVSILEAPGRVD